MSEPYGDVVNSQGVAQHLEIKSSSRPNSPFSLHQGTGVVVQSNHPTHVVVLQPTQLAHGRFNQFNSKCNADRSSNRFHFRINTLDVVFFLFFFLSIYEVMFSQALPSVFISTKLFLLRKQ